MTNPIYIIGNNALACYLGAQLQSGGNDVIMLLDRKNAAEAMATDGISIKEDRSLTQKRHKLNAATFMKEPAKRTRASRNFCRRWKRFWKVWNPLRRKERIL